MTNLWCQKHEFRRRTPYCCQKSRFARFGSGAKLRSTNDETSAKKSSKNQRKIYAKSISETWCKNNEQRENMEPKWEPKSNTNHQKSTKKRGPKIDAKKWENWPGAGSCRGPQGTYLINKISFGNFLNRNLSKEKNILRRLFPWKNPSGGKFLEEKSRRKILEEKS